MRQNTNFDRKFLLQAPLGNMLGKRGFRGVIQSFRFIYIVLGVHFKFLEILEEGNVLTLKSSESPQQSWRKMKIDCVGISIFFRLSINW